MSKVTILVAVVAAVFCAEAVPLPQFDLFSGIPAGQEYQKFATSFAGGIPKIPGSGGNENDDFSGVIGDGNTFSGTWGSSGGSGFSKLFRSTGGSGSHQAVMMTSVSQSGQPTVTKVLYDDNGKISQKVFKSDEN